MNRNRILKINPVRFSRCARSRTGISLRTVLMGLRLLCFKLCPNTRISTHPESSLNQHHHLLIHIEMKYIANQILGDKVYLFNDQMVIKLPQDTLKFEPHYDNQFGPNSDGSIHTVNLSCILDDINVHNGGLEVQNQDDGRWVKLSPKKGDIVAIHGNTYHRSFKNNTNMSRGLYACVYADSPIHFKQFYTQEFI